MILMEASPPRVTMTAVLIATFLASLTGVVTRAQAPPPTNIRPSIVCPAAITVPQYSDYQLPEPAVVDDAGTLRITLTINGNTHTVGALLDTSGTAAVAVTYRAEDVNYLFRECVHTVSIDPNDSPVLTCPADVVLPTDPGTSTALFALPRPSVTDDDSDGYHEFTIDVNSVRYAPDDVVTLPLGSTSFVITVTDRWGNTDSCSTFDVVVVDREAPTLICPEDESVGVAAGTNYFAYPDNSAGSPKVQFSENVDSLLSALTTEAFHAPGIEAPVLAPLNQFDALSLSATGHTQTHEIRHRYTDTAGNAGECSYTLTVTDTQPPTVTAPANEDHVTETDKSFYAWTVPGAAGTADNSNGAPIISVEYLSATGGAIPVAVGQLIRLDVELVHTFQYTATDPSGNTASTSMTVSVSDTQDPVIVCPPDSTVETDAASQGNEPGRVVGVDYASVRAENAAVSDNTDWDGDRLEQTITFDGAAYAAGDVMELALSDSLPTTHDVVHTVSDTADNTASCTQQITVVDREPPVLVCPQDVTVAVADSADFYAYSFRSSVDVPFSDADNSASALVVDITRSYASSTGLGPGITGEAVSSVDTTNFYLQQETTAVYTVTYAATDNSGNVASCSRMLTVVDITPPTVVCGGPIYTGTDNGMPFHSRLMSVANHASATDNSGFDFTSATGVLLEYVALEAYTTTAIAQSTALELDHNMRFGLDEAGMTKQHEVRFTATDPSGNTASCSFDIIVSDSEDPTIRCPLPVTVVTDPGKHYATTYVPQTPYKPVPSHQEVELNELGHVWLDDNSVEAGGELVFQANPSLNGAAQGNLASLPQRVQFPLDTDDGSSGDHNSIEYTVTDPSGNLAQCSNTVRTEDREPPTVVCPADITVKTERPSSLPDLDAGERYTTLNLLAVPVLASRVGGGPDDPNLGIASDNSMAGGGDLVSRIFLSARIVPAGAVVPDTPGQGEAMPRYQDGTSAFSGVHAHYESDLFSNSVRGVSLQDGTGAFRQTSPVSAEALSEYIGYGYSVVSEGRYNFPLELDGSSGTHVIKYAVEDPSGNIASCAQTVTVEDPEDPRIQCPGDAVVDTEDDEDFATVAFYRAHPAPSADPCIVGNVALTPDHSNRQYGLCTDSDNSLTAGGVEDSDYMYSMASTTHEIAYHGTKTMLRAHVSEMIAIDSGAKIQLWLHANGTSRTHFVTHTLTDRSNNSASCTQMITVIDREIPSFTCPPDVTVETSPARPHSHVTIFNPEDAKDNSVKVRNGANGNMQYSAQERHGEETLAVLPHQRTGGHPIPSEMAGQPGITEHGLMQFYNQQPHLRDLHSAEYDSDQRPWRQWIETPAHLGYSITYEGHAIDRTMSQQLASGVAFDFTLNPADESGPINHFVRYEVTDASNNERSCTQTLTVIDVEDPKIYCPNISHADFVGTDQWGAGSETRRYYNSHSNENECAESPGPCENRLIFSASPGATGATVVVPDAAGFDNAAFRYEVFHQGVEISGQLQFFLLPAIPGTPRPEDRLEFRAYDPSGNTASCYRDVLVVDLERPQITCPDDVHVTLYDGAEFTDSLEWDDPLWTDNADPHFQFWIRGALQTRFLGEPGPLGTDPSDCVDMTSPTGMSWSFPPTRCICEAGGARPYFDNHMLFLDGTINSATINNLAQGVSGSSSIDYPISCHRAYQIANTGAYPGTLSVTEVFDRLRSICCSAERPSIFRDFAPRSQETAPLPECEVCGYHPTTQDLRALRMRWNSPLPASPFGVELSVDSADVFPASVLDGDVVTVRPTVEALLYPHRTPSFASGSFFAVDHAYECAVGLDTSCATPLSVGHVLEFDGVGTLTVVGFDVIEGPDRHLRTEADCPVNPGVTPVTGGNLDGGWSTDRWLEHSHNVPESFPLIVCESGVMQSIQSEGCSSSSSNTDKCACIAAVAENGSLALDCTPAGSYVSLDEFAAQYCDDRDEGGAYPFLGSYRYTAPWFNSGQLRPVRRPVSGERFFVRNPATRANNEFVITYTATDVSGNTASCNFTASLQVDCKATALADEEAAGSPAGSAGGWPSVPATMAATAVPCGDCWTGTKSRECGPRGIWENANVSGCVDQDQDTVVTIVLDIFAVDVASGSNPQMVDTGVVREAVAGTSFHAPYGGRWFADECDAFPGSDRVMAEVTDFDRKWAFLHAQTALGLVVNEDSLAKVFKICNPVTEATQPLVAQYEVLTYGSSCSTETISRNLELLYGDGYEGAPGDESVHTVEERRRIYNEAGERMEPSGQVNFTVLPRTITERTYCPNLKWLGMPMNVAERFGEDSIPSALSQQVGIAACPRLHDEVVDTDFGLNATHHSHDDDDAHDDDTSYGSTHRGGTSHHEHSSTGGTSHHEHGSTAHDHQHHHHHHDYCDGLNGVYEHCDHWVMSEACDGLAGTPGSPEMRRACMDLCSAVPSCTGYVVQVPDADTGLCILFNKSADGADFGVDEGSISAHNPHGLENGYAPFSFSASMSASAIASTQDCVTRQHNSLADSNVITVTAHWERDLFVGGQSGKTKKGTSAKSGKKVSKKAYSKKQAAKSGHSHHSHHSHHGHGLSAHAGKSGKSAKSAHSRHADYDFPVAESLTDVWTMYQRDGFVPWDITADHGSHGHSITAKTAKTAKRPKYMVKTAKVLAESPTAGSPVACTGGDAMFLEILAQLEDMRDQIDRIPGYKAGKSSKSKKTSRKVDLGQSNAANDSDQAEQASDPKLNLPVLGADLSVPSDLTSLFPFSPPFAPYVSVPFACG